MMRTIIHVATIAAALAVAACTPASSGGTTVVGTASGGTASGGTASAAETQGGTSAAVSSPSPEATDSSAPDAGQRCRTPKESPGTGMPDVRGVAQDAELWALPFAPLPFTRGKEIKIVWRMTGEGPLEIGATLPDGTRAKRVWGPEGHSGSNWQRPGEEWGTGFVFPKAGCWRLHLTRTTGAGDVWFPVA
jgi:hypothetical protein